MDHGRCELMLGYTSLCYLCSFLTQWEKVFSFLEVRIDAGCHLQFRLVDVLKTFGLELGPKTPFFRVLHYPAGSVFSAVVPLPHFLNMAKVLYSTSTLWSFSDVSKVGCQILDPNSKAVLLHMRRGVVDWDISAAIPKQDKSFQCATHSSVFLLQDIAYALSACSLTESSVKITKKNRDILFQSSNHFGDVEVELFCCHHTPVKDPVPTHPHPAAEITGSLCTGVLKTFLNSVNMCRLVRLCIDYSQTDPRFGSIGQKSRPESKKRKLEASVCGSTAVQKFEFQCYHNNIHFRFLFKSVT